MVRTPNRCVFTGIAVFGVFTALVFTAALAGRPVVDGAQQLAAINPTSIPIDLNRGAPGLARCLAALRTRASLLMITAHPDDEDGGLLAYQTRELGARTALLTLTRGEGGQNAMSMDLYDELGLIRTEELLSADRYYGVEQYWGREIDYGFSKTREEALDKWGYERVLSDVVRVVRMTRPLALISVFVGAPTDGHGNHQVAGQMAQEAFVAAGDPNRFPEQIREGLRPWQPLKVYCRVPFFDATKEHTIYDYATDKYVPLRFFDYINKTWSNEAPRANYTVAEGALYPSAGLSFFQIGREGWGYQKSQNGGGTIPQPAFNSISYHRYGARVPTSDKEQSLYDGIDVSLAGIASLVQGDNVAFVKQGLGRISECVETAIKGYRVDSPAAIARALADGLIATRELLARVKSSNLTEAAKGDIAFELAQKEHQFEEALALSLGVSLDVAVSPAKSATGPFAAFAGSQPTFRVATPGESFGVEAHLVNQGPNPLKIDELNVTAAAGGSWDIHATGGVQATLEGQKDLRCKFTAKVPPDAALTRPYFTRPDQEQPYYDLIAPEFRNLSFAPYPLYATARLSYHGADFQIEKVVETNQRIEGIGMVQYPLLVGPAISVTVSPSAGAVPLDARHFDFSCTVRSNVKGHAEGVLHLDLPKNWQSTPTEVPFTFLRDGEEETLTFRVTPQGIHPENYQIKAVAEYNGKKFEEGFRLVGYPGLRSYPYYRPAVYKAVGVDVKAADGLHIAFLPGTGDDVPRALEDLNLHPQILSASDLETADLSVYDAIILGTRAYAVRPDLRAANKRLLNYVKAGGALIVQYNTQNFDGDYGPYPFNLGNNPQKVVDEASPVKLLDAANPVFSWPNKISLADFQGWQEERGHGFLEKWDSHYQALIETHDPDQDPQSGGLLIARYGRGFYIYDALALYRQLPSGVPGAYRILANLVSVTKNPAWK